MAQTIACEKKSLQFCHSTYLKHQPQTPHTISDRLLRYQIQTT